MRRESNTPSDTKPDEKRPFLYIACEAEPDEAVRAYIQAMRPYLAANGIDCIIGPEHMPAGVRPPDLYYYPSLCYPGHSSERSGRAGRYSILRVDSMHPAAPSFRCAERIKRYREPLSARPIYISRVQKRVMPAPPAVWDQLTSRADDEAAAAFLRSRKELARQTVRGFCDYFGLPFEDA